MKSPGVEETVAPQAAQRNISKIADLQSEFDERRSAVDRIVADVADWTGSVSFILLHLAWFACWILINGTSLLPFKKFDPFPFVLLSVAVSCEAVLLSTVVLMKQNWMSARDEHREQLQLQISLLSEQEVTKVLFLQRLICRRLGIEEADKDPDVIDLSQETVVEHLASELSDSLNAG